VSDAPSTWRDFWQGISEKANHADGWRRSLVGLCNAVGWTFAGVTPSGLWRAESRCYDRTTRRPHRVEAAEPWALGVEVKVRAAELGTARQRRPRVTARRVRLSLLVDPDPEIPWANPADVVLLDNVRELVPPPLPRRHATLGIERRLGQLLTFKGAA
jgi:hypothetical protein